MSGYAVVDVETTGFSPAKHDRIVEIAIVHVSEHGEVTDEWCTLVDPGRDLGPQRIHGIKGSDLIGAPTFADVAAAVAARLQGRVFAAHNARFDALFLAAEFARAGVNAPIDNDHVLCTMRLASRYLATASRSLAACCAVAGVPLLDAHSALADAIAAASLLRIYLIRENPPPPWSHLVDLAASARWPNVACPLNALLPKQRGGSDSELDGQWIQRLVATMPRIQDPPAADAYLDLLDRALLDRALSETEKTDLVGLAKDLGLSRAEVIVLHRDYLDALAVAAWADGVVTAEERVDLDRVAVLLGLDAGTVDDSLDHTGPGGGVARRGRPQFELEPGDRIVFTGDMVRSRDEWIRLVEAAGLTTGGVTKKTKILVAADPDSRSGKAKKARDYGVAAVDEAAFVKLFSNYLRAR